MYKNKNGGFSLLELIVVIAIMAVLGGIVIGNSNYSKSAQVKKYTELTDGFMRKARTEIMSKNTVSGVCLYEKEGCYYKVRLTNNKGEKKKTAELLHLKP